MTTLDQLSQGQRARVETVSGSPGVVQRLYEMGLLEGDEIEVVRFAPLGDPIEIRIANTHLSLRRIEAAGVKVTPD
jgi:ferrous iron transport protein A